LHHEEYQPWNAFQSQGIFVGLLRKVGVAEEEETRSAKTKSAKAKWVDTVLEVRQKYGQEYADKLI
jgi:hypothetical protein